MSVRTAREVAEQFIAASTDPAGQALHIYYAPSVVIELPFAPPGFPNRIETTRDELAARWSQPRSHVFEETLDVAIHETADPDVVIVEYTLRGTNKQTQDAFDLPFILVITVKDGHIVHSRDYSDPIAGARALGLLPRLVEALTNLTTDG